MAIEKDISESTLKCMVDNLLRHIKTHPLDEPKRARVQEAIAATLGYSNWHEAITRIKQKNEPEPASEQGQWRIPLDWQNSDITRFLGSTLTTSDFEHRFARIKQSTLTGHAVLHGTEAQRRDFLDRLTQLNPKRPLLLIQGALALPLRHWKGEQAGMVASAQLLQQGGLNEVVGGLYAHINTASTEASLWAAKGLSMATAVLTALLELRDRVGEKPTWASIRKPFQHVSELEKLSADKRLTPISQQSLKSYLRSLPQSSSKDDNALQDQHGLVAMHVIDALERLETSTRTYDAYQGTWAAQQWISIPHENAREMEMRVMELAHDWVRRHPGGMVVFDGLEAESMLWLSLPRYLAQWSDAGSPVLIGLLQCDVGASFDHIRQRVIYDIQL